MIKLCVGLHVKYHFFVVRFLRNLSFLDRFSKNPQISNFCENPFSWSRVVPCKRTDRKADGRADKHNEVNCRFS